MTFTEQIAYLDSLLRPKLLALHPYLCTAAYTYGRKFFLHSLISEVPPKMITMPDECERELWGIKFQSPLFNAAGMFKSGKGYIQCAYQGAGAFLTGTTTQEERAGNFKMLLKHPFVPYSQAGASSNWMGLPNEGHKKVARRIQEIEKRKGCPVGASIAAQPEHKESEALSGVLEGLRIYEKAGADFIEINESCPNVKHSSVEHSSDIDDRLINRLEQISSAFLKKRNRRFPVILKLSNDTNPEQLPALLDCLLELKFDGLNLGNTSTDYNKISEKMSNDEKRVFHYFSSNFGGGISGRPLREKSLKLVRTANEYLKGRKSNSEFHIISVGGIEKQSDFIESELAGASICQWFTGYFENFSRNGYNTYKYFFEEL